MCGRYRYRLLAVRNAKPVHNCLGTAPSVSRLTRAPALAYTLPPRNGPPPGAEVRAMMFDPLAYPTCFLQPIWLTHSEWMEHLPFGMALVEMLRPRLLVELGTFYGVSYCGMCQALARLGVPACALAVDTWEGDPQSGQFATKVYDRLRAHHDARYGHFSQLFRGTFDEALPTIADGAIDLLHIDGYHTYEAA